MEGTSVEERWELVPGYPFYRVSTLGRPQSRLCRGGKVTDSWNDIKPYRGRKGYLKVRVRNEQGEEQVYVHALVLRTFVGPRPDGMECRHLNGNKLDNRLVNLAWGTWAENRQDAINHNGGYFGAAAGGPRRGYKLNPDQVREIRRLAGSDMGQAQLARMYGVSRSLINSIVNRKKWSYVA